MHVPVPLISLPDPVTADPIRKAAYDAGLLKGLVIHRNDPHADGFKPAVKIQSQGHALDLRGFHHKMLQVFL